MPTDTLQRFIFEKHNIRGALVRLQDTVSTIFSQHEYPPAAKPALAQASLAVALLADSIKFDGQLTLQFRGDGFIQLLVVKCTHQREVRAMLRWDDELKPQDVERALGKGELVLTVEYDKQVKPYQSIIPIDNQSVFEALAAYFEQSEQLPTRFYYAFEGEHAVALMLQKMPGPLPGDLWHELGLLADTVTSQEMLACDNAILLRRLFNEYDLRLYPPNAVTFHCPCSSQRMERALLTLGEKEANEMLQQHKLIEVKCDFCGHTFAFDKQQVAQIFNESASPAKPA